VQLIDATDAVALVQDLRWTCFDEKAVKVRCDDGRLVTAIPREQLEADLVDLGGDNLVTTGEQMSTGCHYFEVEIVSYGRGVGVLANPQHLSAPQIFIGVCSADATPGLCDIERDTVGCWLMCANFGDRYGSRNGLYGVLEDLEEDVAGGYEEGESVGVEVNFDDGSVTFFKNRVPHGTGYPPGSIDITRPVVHAVALGHGTAAMLRPCLQRVVATQ
jgi:hypothetical protein